MNDPPISDPRAEDSTALQQLLADPILRAVADAWVNTQSDGLWPTLAAKMEETTHAKTREFFAHDAMRQARTFVAMYAACHAAYPHGDSEFREVGEAPL